MSDSSELLKIVEQRPAEIPRSVPETVSPTINTDRYVRASAPGAFQLSDDQAAVSLRYFIKKAKRYAWIVGAVVSLALVATYFVTSRIEPLYESTVTLKVERRSNNGFIGQQASAPPEGDSDQLMATQLDLIQSDSVLRPATGKFHLLALEKQFNGLTAAEIDRKQNAPIKLKRLKVAHVPNTYILKIAYRASDPQVAADVANLIAESYIAHAFDTRDRSYDLVATVVNRQLEDLRKKMTASADALVRFERELNVVDPEGRVSMLSSRLLQLNNDYTAAQAERLRKQATLDATKSGSIAAAEASGHGEPLERLLERLNEARQQFAAIRTVYGENHPEYKKALSQTTELEAQVKELKSTSQQRVEADYEQTVTREELSRKLVTETKEEVERLSARSHEYVELKRDADNYKKLYEDLQRVTREEKVNRSFQDAIIQVADPARPGAKAVSPSLPLNLSVGFVLSSFFGLAGVFLFDLLDSRVATVEDARRAIAVDVLATIPKFKTTDALRPGGLDRLALPGKVAESTKTPLLLEYQDAIRTLRNAVELTRRGGSYKSILLTSATAGEGKSTIAANLAFSYAMLGRKTLVIDADLRRPSLHTLFGASASTGLSEVLSQSISWQESLIKVAREPLYFLPAGTYFEDSSDVITSGLSHLLERIYREFDMVVIDGPPLLGIPETLQLAKSAAGVLLVARAGSSTTPLINEASASLARAQANVVGLVMNNVKPDRSLRDGGYYRPAVSRVA